MKKKLLIIIPAVLVVAITAAAVIVFSGNRSFTEGVIFESANGNKYFIDSSNCPIVMYPRTKSAERQIEKLSDGDGVLLLHDGIDESYPAQTGAYYIIDLKKKVDKAFTDEMPEALNGISYTPDVEISDYEEDIITPTGYDHNINPIINNSDNLVDDPVFVSCGNTVTRIKADGEEYSFMYADSCLVHDLIGNLRYEEEQCDGIPELIITLEDGVDYFVNLSEGRVWVNEPSQMFSREKTGRCTLTDTQTKTLQKIVLWAKQYNMPSE